MLIATSSNPWWVAITVGLISGLFSLFGIIMSNKLKVSSDIKAKTRIHWIQSLKDSTNELNSSIINYRIFINDRKHLDNEVIRPEFQSEFIKIVLDVIDKENNFLLCFANNDEFDKLKFPSYNPFYIVFKFSSFIKKYNVFKIQKIISKNKYSTEDTHLYDLITNRKTNYRKNYYIQIFIKDRLRQTNIDPNDLHVSPTFLYNSYLTIYQITEIVSIYIKIEWDIAKKGK